MCGMLLEFSGDFFGEGEIKRKFVVLSLLVVAVVLMLR